MTTLCDLLAELRDLACSNTDNIKSITASYPAVEAVSAGDWDDLEPLLDSVKSDAEQILSNAQQPSYSPWDAGSASSYDPDDTTTADLGSDACERAKAAYNAACVDDPTNHAESAEKLRDVLVIVDKLIAQADPT